MDIEENVINESWEEMKDRHAQELLRFEHNQSHRFDLSYEPGSEEYEIWNDATEIIQKMDLERREIISRQATEVKSFINNQAIKQEQDFCIELQQAVEKSNDIRNSLSIFDEENLGTSLKRDPSESIGY